MSQTRTRCITSAGQVSTIIGVAEHMRDWLSVSLVQLIAPKTKTLILEKI